MEQFQTKHPELNKSGIGHDQPHDGDLHLEKLLNRQIWITNQLRNELYELSLKNKYDSIINSIILEIYRSQNLNEIFYNVVNSIQNIVDSIDQVMIFTIADENVRLADSTGLDDNLRNKISKVSNRNGFIWKTVSLNTTITCSDITREISVSDEEKLLGIKSYISTTIKYKGHAYGSIVMASKEKDISDKQNVRLAETVALQLEIALKHHFQEKKLIESQVELEERYRQLKRMSDHEAIIRYIAENVHKSINIEEVMENSVNAMCKYMHSAEQVSIFMVEDDNAVLKTFHGKPEWNHQKKYKIPRVNGITWKTVIDSKPKLINDLEKECEMEAVFKEYGIKSILSVPLISKEETHGIIHVASSKKDAFTDEDLLLLEIIAKQIENALKNARQAELLKKANDQLEQRVEERTRNVVETNRKLLSEINERKKIEKDIKNSLKEKEVLLMEIHHRVKNNLQIITSLLNLQSKKIRDDNLKKMFDESKSRIKSMSILHEQLYRSKVMNKIDFNKYLINLTNHISRSQGQGNKKISVNIKAKGAMLDINKAIPCGLMVNELVSNAYEHGFNNKTSRGHIEIEFSESDEVCILAVKNDGKKLPDNFNIENSDSLGLQLVTSLCRQIRGKLDVNNKNGVEFKITFKA